MVNNLPRTGDVIIIGDNFVSEQLQTDFKRYSKFKSKKFNSVNAINNDNLNIVCIIDCSFNNKVQDDSIDYVVNKNINRLIILNHWKRFIDDYKDVVIIQAIIPDIYSENHPSFDRQGPGNNFENDINYCSLIAETIRRLHESKIGFIPNTYIKYSEDTIKYLHVSNLYKSIDYTIKNIKTTSEYELYDEYKSIGLVLNKIKEVVGYTGNLVLEKTDSRNNKPIKRLPFKYNYNSLDYNIRFIYRYLSHNNERFLI